MDTQSPYDVVIAGGGVIGSAIAYFLAQRDDFSGTIAVIEKDSSYTQCSTSLSVGSIRQQFSNEENIAMSQFGVEFLREMHNLLAVDGDIPDVALVEGGYLFLATQAGMGILEANHSVQKRQGVQTQLLNPTELQDRYPWMHTEDLSGASLGLAGEGWLDPYMLLQAFRAKARSLGVVYIEGEVVEVQRLGRQIHGVQVATQNGSTGVGCGTLINAVGPRARELATLAGIPELPVHPRKRNVFVFDCRAELQNCPLVIDPSGVYFRPEGKHFICGMSPDKDNDPDTLSCKVDHELFEEVLWPTLASRVPAFEAIKPIRGWAGHYAYNVVDQNAVLGGHPEIDNYLMANGFSGHGLQQAPAVGRAISELVVHKTYKTLDLSRLGFGRFAAGAPMVERNVI